jgi:hypothetical protein
VNEHDLQNVLALARVRMVRGAVANDSRRVSLTMVDPPELLPSVKDPDGYLMAVMPIDESLCVKAKWVES